MATSSSIFVRFEWDIVLSACVWEQMKGMTSTFKQPQPVRADSNHCGGHAMCQSEQFPCVNSFTAQNNSRAGTNGKCRDCLIRAQSCWWMSGLSCRAVHWTILPTTQSPLHVYGVPGDTEFRLWGKRYATCSLLSWHATIC